MVSVEFGIDLDEVRRVIDSAEVLVVRFSTTTGDCSSIAERTRQMGRSIASVPPVASAEERFKALKQMRPRFRSPERILTSSGHGTLVRLAESGIWEYMARRVVALG